MTSCRTNPKKVGIQVLEGMSGAPHTHDTCSNGQFVRGLSAWEGYLSMYLFAHFLVLDQDLKELELCK